MGALLTQVEADLALTLEDLEGAGNAITLTDPAATSVVLAGQVDDVAEQIDPDTLLVINLQHTEVVLRIKSVELAFPSDFPMGIVLPADRPWLVTFDDAQGVSGTWAVKETRPDRTVGVVRLILGAYTP